MLELLEMSIKKKTTRVEIIAKKKELTFTIIQEIIDSLQAGLENK